LVNKNYGAAVNQGVRVRLGTEERREQLLGAGVELLRQRPHEDVSTEQIAEAAGVSKGLLYHYFPTKRDFIVAAVERGQRQLSERLRPDPGLAPEAQLGASLSSFLDYVEEHATAYVEIFRKGSGDPELAAVLDAGRAEQMQVLLKALRDWKQSPVSAKPTPALETAVQGWMFFVEGAVLRWLEQRDLGREKLLIMLQVAFGGALVAARAAGAPPPAGKGG
jgi:AcrR family transcriptional regulator